MHWYSYRQNNSGGSFIYDQSSGISVNVWIEANSAQHADDRAQSIGIYFDGSGDCSCCGNRWSSKASYWNDDPESENPPTPDEPIYKDEFNSGFSNKWRPEGEYETFVHPLGQEFYGAHATTKVVRKLTYGGENGYGLTVGTNWVTPEPVPVSELGWDKEGNFSAPSPGYRYYRPSDDHIFYITENGIRIDHVLTFRYASVWAPTKELADKIIAEINDYLDTTPRPDTVKELLRLYPYKKFTPEPITLFSDDDKQLMS
jgi:hypothetical protein